MLWLWSLFSPFLPYCVSPHSDLSVSSILLGLGSLPNQCWNNQGHCNPCTHTEVQKCTQKCTPWYTPSIYSYTSTNRCANRCSRHNTLFVQKQCVVSKTAHMSGSIWHPFQHDSIICQCLPKPLEVNVLHVTLIWTATSIANVCLGFGRKNNLVKVRKRSWSWLKENGNRIRTQHVQVTCHPSTLTLSLRIFFAPSSTVVPIKT